MFHLSDAREYAKLSLNNGKLHTANNVQNINHFGKQERENANNQQAIMLLLLVYFCNKLNGKRVYPRTERIEQIN